MYRCSLAPALASAICACGLVAGCGPLTELTPASRSIEPYAEAFDLSREAGLAVLDANAASDEGAGAAPYAAALGPERMDARACAARYGAEALQARCAALEAVFTFNEAASAQAQGFNGARFLAQSVASLAALKAAPGGLALAGVATRLDRFAAARRFETARRPSPW